MTIIDPPKIRITDWDRPLLPLPLRVFNFFFEWPARLLVVLEIESLLAAARRRTGLSDFGADNFREPLRALVRSLRTETPLSAFGRIVARETIIKLLVGRLRLEDLYRRHPEIDDEPLRRPIIIAGPPRTGTTHLFNLLSRDASLNWMPYWETLEPFPSKDEASPRARVAAGGQALKLLDWAMPRFSAFHEFANDGPHEELQLLAMNFTSLLFCASNLVPSYSKWYDQSDRGPTYAYLKRCLKALQYLRGNRRRWVLKTSEHLANLRHVAKEFPDATYVQTHRDPVRIVASMCAMTAYGTRMQHKGNVAHDMAHQWSSRTEELLRSSVNDRHLLPTRQVVDVHFDDFMADMNGTVRRIFERAGHPFSEETDEAIKKFLLDNPKGKHGSVDYRAAMDDLGIDPEERRRTLSFYRMQFNVEEDFLK